MVTHTKRTQRKEAREGHHLYRRDVSFNVSVRAGGGPAGKTFTSELSRGYAKTTNNRMELMAVIVALEALNRPCEVEVHSDSQYVVNAFNKHWIDGWKKRGWKTANKQPVKNRDLWERLLAAKSKHKVEFIWVKGHAGHELNERCDELATTAADGSNLDIDTGFNESDL